jgi:hypothetical protein
VLWNEAAHVVALSAQCRHTAKESLRRFNNAEA